MIQKSENTTGVLSSCERSHKTKLLKQIKQTNHDASVFLHTHTRFFSSQRLLLNKLLNSSLEIVLKQQANY